MNESIACPVGSHLFKLLAGSLSPSEQDDVTTHLDTCVSCQETMETMAAAGRPVPQSISDWENDEPAMEPALIQTMKNLESLAEKTSRTVTDESNDDTPMTFLDPPSRKEYLGRLGRYDILEVVRRGGMGWILKSFDPKLNRVVAIKVIAPQLATSAAARQRFAREAQAVGVIRNPNVIDVYSVEETNSGVPYLVMEFVEGMSLQDRLDAGGTLELPEILWIGVQTAKGLAAAHERGLIHRDIKPGNILLEACTGRVKVTDFGLARAPDDASLTQSGLAAGTPNYMAPEQARSESVDYRADLFSFGSVLYAMCTGQPPFRAKSHLATLNQVCDEMPPPIREFNAAIPEWLVQVIAKLHAKEPNDRYHSANEIAQLLEAYLENGTEPKRIQSSAVNHLVASPTQKRNRWISITVALVASLVALIITEATGATNLASSVIRVVTPDGTLVVEVDDPAIKVTIENDGKEIVIKGARVQEVRLRPGNHQINATQAGKPLPLRENVVTIKSGAKQVVRVSREEVVVNRPLLLFDQAVSLYERGVKLRDTDAVAAERIQRQALDTLTRLQAESPTDPRYMQHLENCRWYLGSTLNLQAARLVKDPRINGPDTKRAMALSQEAVKLIPKDGGIVFTLGLGQYRNNDWKAAVVSGMKAAELHHGGEAKELFLLAMAQSQLGDKIKARDYYDKGIAWMEKHRPTDNGVESLRSEAAQLLGIAPSDR